MGAARGVGQSASHASASAAAGVKAILGFGTRLLHERPQQQLLKVHPSGSLIGEVCDLLHLMDMLSRPFQCLVGKQLTVVISDVC